MSRPVVPRAALGIALLGSLALTGCTGHGTVTSVRAAIPVTALAAFGALDLLSVVNTQKTVDDHIVSLITGNDCSTVRASRGEAYCQAPMERVPTVRRTAYCYRSLASVTCFDQPVPRDSARLLGVQALDVAEPPPSPN